MRDKQTVKYSPSFFITGSLLIPLSLIVAAEKSLISIDKYIHLHNISFDKDDTFPSLPPFETSFSPKPNIKGENPKTIPKPEPELPYDEPPLSPTDSEASSTVSQHKPSRSMYLVLSHCYIVVQVKTFMRLISDDLLFGSCS